jgi:hypothetical protein
VIARRKTATKAEGLPPKVRPRPKPERQATDLRAEAAGRMCQVRIPGVCQAREDDCVLAHLQYPAGVRGMGQKAPDLLGAWACSACHNEVDRRTTHCERDFVRTCMYEGVIRTQRILILEGKVTW